MKLAALIALLKKHIVSLHYEGTALSVASLDSPQRYGFLNQMIKGLSLHSQRIEKGFVFFCLSGTTHEGSEFITDAYRKGAIAAVVGDSQALDAFSESIIIIIVKDVSRCLGTAANAFYDFPLKNINLTAITGTNGKTTTTYILENILKACAMNSGVIGTVNYRIKNNIWPAPTTTPDIVTIFDFMKKMRSKKAHFLFMEVSSHALAQNRIAGLLFDQAILTNVSQDHFDYHRTKQRYFSAKSLLFKRYLKKGATAIINYDDCYGRKLLLSMRKNKKIQLLTYGMGRNANVRALNVRLHLEGSSAIIDAPQRRFQIETNLIGLFNLYNILAAISVCLVCDIGINAIIKGLCDVKVPGRLEKVPSQSGISIFVDYAHTPDALRNVLGTARSLKKQGRLISVFGCGGDRDKTKRAPMGRIATQLSDYVILTSDNPRTEDPQEIIADIKQGIQKNNCCCIVDRKEAIKKAIAIATNNDIIVVAGKGHENYQIINKEKKIFSDRCVIEEILAQKI